MKNHFYFLFLCLVLALTSNAQVTTKITGDSIRLFQTGQAGHTELIIENGTKGLTGAFLRNKGNGRTEFAYAIDSVWLENGQLKFTRAGVTKAYTLPEAIAYSGVAGVQINSITHEITAPGKVDSIKIRNDSLFEFKAGNVSFKGVVSSQAPFWNNIQGDITSRSDLMALFNSKQNLLPSGSASQYYRANGSIGLLSTDVLAITDPAYAQKVHGHQIGDIAGLPGVLANKQDLLQNGINIKSVNGVSLLGSGNITISGGGGGLINNVASNFQVSGDTLNLAFVPTSKVTGSFTHSIINDFDPWTRGLFSGPQLILYNNSTGAITADTASSNGIVTKNRLNNTIVANALSFSPSFKKSGNFVGLPGDSLVFTGPKAFVREKDTGYFMPILKVNNTSHTNGTTLVWKDSIYIDQPLSQIDITNIQGGVPVLDTLTGRFHIAPYSPVNTSNLLDGSILSWDAVHNRIVPLILDYNNDGTLKNVIYDPNENRFYYKNIFQAGDGLELLQDSALAIGGILGHARTLSTTSTNYFQIIAPIDANGAAGFKLSSAAGASVGAGLSLDDKWELYYVKSNKGFNLRWMGSSPFNILSGDSTGTISLPKYAGGTNTSLLGITTTGNVTKIGNTSNIGWVMTMTAGGPAWVASTGGSGSSYTLPLANSTTLGGIKLGTGFSVAADSTVSVNVPSYSLPIASGSTLGGVKIGTGLSVAADGTISATGGSGGTGSYTLPAATASTLGGVIAGSNMSIAADGTINPGSNVPLLNTPNAFTGTAFWNTNQTATTNSTRAAEIIANLTAHANNDTLIALRIRPYINANGFTNITPVAIMAGGNIMPEQSGVWQNGTSIRQWSQTTSAVYASIAAMNLTTKTAGAAMTFQINNATQATLSGNGNLNLGGAITDTLNTLFSARSTTKGTKPFPLMLGFQRDAIATPTEGLSVYNLSTHTVDYYNGSSWTAIGTGSSVSPIVNYNYAYVDTLGNDATAVVGRPDKPFKTINAALDATALMNYRVIQIGVGTFSKIDYTKLKSGTWLKGSGMPSYNNTVTISDYYTTTIATPTALIGGTIIKGGFGVSNVGNFKITDLGIDQGSDYIASGGTQDNCIGDGNGGLTPPYAAIKNVYIENVATLESAYNTQFHCIVLEGMYEPVVKNVKTWLGFAGLVIKNVGGTYSGIEAHGHSLYGIIVKSNNYGPPHEVNISDFHIYDGYGLVFRDEYQGVWNVNVSQGFIKNCTYSVMQETAFMDGVSLTGIQVINPVGKGFNLIDFRNGNISNCIVRNGNDIGFSVTGKVSTLSNNKAISNSGAGFSVSGTSASQPMIMNGNLSLGNSGSDFTYGSYVYGDLNYGNGVSGSITTTSEKYSASTASGSTGGSGGGGNGSKTWVDLTYSAARDASVSYNSTTKTLSTNTTSGNWMNGNSLDTKVLPATTEGMVVMYWDGSQSGSGIIGFLGGSTKPSNFTDYYFGIYLQGSNNHIVAIYNNIAHDTSIPFSPGNYYGVYRDPNGGMYVVTSSDKITWNYTLQSVANNQAQMGLGASLAGDGTVTTTIIQPQGWGIQ